MTINEERQLRNYITGLVKKSLNEMWDPFLEKDTKMLYVSKEEEGGYVAYDPKLKKKAFVPEDMVVSHNPEDVIRIDSEDYNRLFLDEPEESEEDIAGIEGDEEDYNDYEDEDDAGIMARVHQMMESMARDAVKEYLSESKKGGKKYNKAGSKRTGKKGAEKKGNKDKTISAFLNSDGVNAAAYAYKLYGAKTPAQKAAARSKLYKKAKGKKNDTGVPYKFNSKELSRLQNYSKDKTLK